MKKKLLLSTALFFAGLVQANNIHLNQPLPTVTVTDSGEVTLQDGKIGHKPWYSQELKGKVRVLQHIAGRVSAQKMNNDLMVLLGKEKLNPKDYQTTTIINGDDEMFGTGFLIERAVNNGKKDHPGTQVVMDNKGVVKKAWDLKPEDSLIVVLDKAGKVRFVNEGKLTQAQIKEVLDLTQKLQ